MSLPSLPALALVMVAALLCAGCAVQHAAVTLDPPQQHRQKDIDRFAPGRALLPQLTPPVPGATWRSGDSVLLGIAIETRHDSRIWYLRATLIDKVHLEVDGRTYAMRDSTSFQVTDQSRRTLDFEYDIVEVRVELFDEDMSPVSTTISRMPELSLQHSLVDFIQLSRMERADALKSGILDDEGALADPDALRAFAAALIVMVRLPEFLQGHSAMDQLLWRLIERPGLVSVLANRGVRLGLWMSGEQAEDVEAPPGFGPAYRLPVRVTLNDRKAIECHIVVVRGDPPLGPCNGLLAIDAAHPRDPSRRLTVRLLGAARGEEPRAQQAVRSTP